MAPWHQLDNNSEQPNRTAITVVAALAIIAAPLTLTGDRLLRSAADHDDGVSAAEMWLEERPELELVQLNLDRNEVDVVLIGDRVTDDADVVELADLLVAALDRSLSDEVRLIAKAAHEDRGR
jgi:hypothetical protein